ncbi:MAG: redoxin domain-containing protein [Proteobacteria bacterium]|nr:redoxin domain-containing protein [Pseudomonadota bacterium]
MRHRTRALSWPPSLLVAALALGLALSACGGEEPDAVADPGTAQAAEPAAKPAAATRRAGERPIPAFEGFTLDGEKISASAYIGRRFLLFFFNPEVSEAVPVAQAVARIAELEGKHNFRVLGISMGSTAARTRAFVAEHDLDFPVIDDSSARIASKLNIRFKVALLGVDPEGYFSFAQVSFPETGGDLAGQVATQLREQLRLPAAHASAGALVDYPKAPLFEAEYMDDGSPFRMADIAGEPAVVIFFLHTCPHCHHALRFLERELAKLPEDGRPHLVAIEVTGRVSSIRNHLREQKLEFFRVLLDPGEKAAKAYGVFAGVPDVNFINAEGEIVHRVKGWDKGRMEALSRMWLAKIAGARVPMLLNPEGYTGNDVCGVCHEAEHATWELTRHASAYDTLVTHGEDRNAECVGCHVVGFEKPGGFEIADNPDHLEDVGCESCHGRGGPHLSPQFVTNGNYESACITCHDTKHSLGFEYASFRPKISHTGIAALSPEERAALVAAHGKPRDVLASAAVTVGSDACQSCHQAEYETWAKSPHAHAGKTLSEKGKATDADCQRCHTTNFGRDGGFAAGMTFAGASDLSRVGCESCHGAGGEHVKEGAPKLGTIVSLGDKCDSCVILQICGSCHDDVNDPGFEFEVLDKIDRQRHGTIEAGTGKPLAPTAGRIEAEVQRAFALLPPEP